MSRLWILPVLGLLSVAAFACSSSEDLPSTTATISSSPTVSQTSTAPTPAASVPPDWLTYTHPTAGFSFRYPPDWSLQEYPSGSQARVASFDLSTWTGPNYPAGGILLDFGRKPSSPGSPQPRPSDATDATLGTLPGWTRRPPDAGEGPGAKSVYYVAEQGEYTYYLAAAFDLADADESIVQMIASTFTVGN